jgi:hypothetical protein
MDFSTTNRVPLTVRIDRQPYQLPPVRRKFWIEWASEVNARRLEEATDKLTPTEEAKFLSVFVIQGTTEDDLLRMIRTPEGKDRIIRDAAKRGNVPDDVVNKLLGEDADVPEGDLTFLALMLAGVVKSSAIGEPGDKKEGADDPLALSKPGSAGS